MQTIVAARRLLGRTPEGSNLDIVCSVGMPYPCEGRDWACPVSVTPLFDQLPDMQGLDSFQALELAIKLVHNLLEGFIEKGGSLYMDGDEFPA
jgi:hypothetical protein